jgi:L-lactate permease
LSGVTGIDVLKLSAMIGKQLPPFSLIIPFWVVWAMAGFRGMIEVWPAALAAGAFFAIPQYLISNLHGPWLVDIVSSLSSILATVMLLKFWRPKSLWKLEDAPFAANVPTSSRGGLARAWTPWLLLTIFIFVGTAESEGFSQSSGGCGQMPMGGPVFARARNTRTRVVSLPGAPPEGDLLLGMALRHRNRNPPGGLCAGGLIVI